MALPDNECVDLITQGALRGEVGEISGQLLYYNYDSGSMIPLGDSWSGTTLTWDNFPKTESIHDGVHTVDGTPAGLFGDTTTPYYMCPIGKEYNSPTYGEIAGFSVSLGTLWTVTGETLHIDALAYYTIFDRQGNPVHTHSENLGRDLLDNALNGVIYAECYGGYNDNNGYYQAGVVFGNEEIHGEDLKRYSITQTLMDGDSPLAYFCAWGDGQHIINDDGVTPTGGSGGGGGTYSRTDETVGIPNLPSLSLTDLGVSALYRMTPQQVRDLSTYLWSDNFVDTILKNFDSPMENIISLSMCPMMNYSEAGAEVIIGNKASGVTGYKLFTNYYEIDCGSIYVNEYYKNFADYHTEISIYLPFIGIREIPVNDCMSGYIKVVYHVDVFSGSCVAFIQTQVGKGAWHVIQTHNGNINASIPLSGQNFAQVYQGLLGAVGSAFSGNPFGMASSLLNAKPQYQKSGNIGAMTGALSIRYPYLIFTTPQIFTANGFKDSRGYVSNLSGTIQTFINAKDKPTDVAFIQVDTNKLDLTDLVITDDEREMLYQMLDDGIYI